LLDPASLKIVGRDRVTATPDGSSVPFRGEITFKKGDLSEEGPAAVPSLEGGGNPAASAPQPSLSPC